MNQDEDVLKALQNIIGGDSPDATPQPAVNPGPVPVSTPDDSPANPDHDFLADIDSQLGDVDPILGGSMWPGTPLLTRKPSSRRRTNWRGWAVVKITARRNVRKLWQRVRRIEIRSRMRNGAKRASQKIKGLSWKRSGNSQSSTVTSLNIGQLTATARTPIASGRTAPLAASTPPSSAAQPVPASPPTPQPTPHPTVRLPKGLLVVWVTMCAAVIGLIFALQAIALPSLPTMPQTNWSMIGLVVLAILVIAFLVWLFRSPTRRTAMSATMTGWSWGLALRNVALVLFCAFLGIAIWQYFTTKPFVDKPFQAAIAVTPECLERNVAMMVKITHELSTPIPVPLGCKVIWNRQAVVAYQVLINGTVPRAYPRVLVPLPKFKDQLSFVQFQVTDTEIDTVEVELIFSLNKEEGEATAKVVSEPTTPPVPPDPPTPIPPPVETLTPDLAPPPLDLLIVPPGTVIKV